MSVMATAVRLGVLPRELFRRPVREVRELMAFYALQDEARELSEAHNDIKGRVSGASKN